MNRNNFSGYIYFLIECNVYFNFICIFLILYSCDGALHVWRLFVSLQQLSLFVCFSIGVILSLEVLQNTVFIVLCDSVSSTYDNNIWIELNCYKM